MKSENARPSRGDGPLFFPNAPSPTLLSHTNSEKVFDTTREICNSLFSVHRLCIYIYIYISFMYIIRSLYVCVYVYVYIYTVYTCMAQLHCITSHPITSHCITSHNTTYTVCVSMNIYCTVVHTCMYI